MSGYKTDVRQPWRKAGLEWLKLALLRLWLLPFLMEVPEPAGDLHLADEGATWTDSDRRPGCWSSGRGTALPHSMAAPSVPAGQFSSGVQPSRPGQLARLDDLGLAQAIIENAATIFRMSGQLGLFACWKISRLQQGRRSA